MNFFKAAYISLLFLCLPFQGCEPVIKWDEIEFTDPAKKTKKPNLKTEIPPEADLSDILGKKAGENLLGRMQLNRFARDFFQRYNEFEFGKEFTVGDMTVWRVSSKTTSNYIFCITDEKKFLCAGKNISRRPDEVVIEGVILFLFQNITSMGASPGVDDPLLAVPDVFAKNISPIECQLHVADSVVKLISKEDFSLVLEDIAVQKARLVSISLTSGEIAMDPR
jgi:hypothetical protein